MLVLKTRQIHKRQLNQYSTKKLKLKNNSIGHSQQYMQLYLQYVACSIQPQCGILYRLYDALIVFHVTNVVSRSNLCPVCQIFQIGERARRAFDGSISTLSLSENVLQVLSSCVQTGNQIVCARFHLTNKTLEIIALHRRQNIGEQTCRSDSKCVPSKTIAVADT